MLAKTMVALVYFGFAFWSFGDLAGVALAPVPQAAVPLLLIGGLMMALKDIFCD